MAKNTMVLVDWKAPIEEAMYALNNWEEIIEKDYEILSFNDLGLIVKQPDGLFKRINGNTLVTEKQISHFRIHSIKRLSDGE